MKSALQKPLLFGVTLLLIAIVIGRNVQHQKLLGSLFPYSVEVVVHDSETGAHLSNLSIGYPISHPQVPSSRGRFSQQTSDSFVLTGIGVEKAVFRIGADGYEDKEVTIRPETSREVSVELAPVRDLDVADPIQEKFCDKTKKSSDAPDPVR